MKAHYRTLVTCIASGILSMGLQAQVVWDGGAGDGLWSSAANWNPDGVPSATDIVEWTDAATVNVDTAVTNSFYRVSGAPSGNVILGGTGTMTLDMNSGNALGLEHGSSTGTVMQIGSLKIANSGGGITWAYCKNSSSNILRFIDLELVTSLETRTFGTSAGAVELNGVLTGADIGTALRVNNNEGVTFGPSFDGSNFAGQYVYINSTTSNRTITVEEGAVVRGAKFQSNATFGWLILNGTDAIQDVNVVVGSGRTLTIDVNASNMNFGFVDSDGTLTLDLSGGNSIGFADSSNLDWAGSVTIIGFAEGSVRFGTSKTAITGAQLAAIAGGPYYLDYDGYLTTTEPAADPFRDLFPTAVPYPDSWYNVAWIASGWMYAAQFPWVLSQEHGWWWAGSASAQQYWSYDSVLGWIYASPAMPNFYYRAGDSAWLFHQPETGVYGAERWFYNYQTSTWAVL